MYPLFTEMENIMNVAALNTAKHTALSAATLSILPSKYKTTAFETTVSNAVNYEPENVQVMNGKQLYAVEHAGVTYTQQGIRGWYINMFQKLHPELFTEADKGATFRMALLVAGEEKWEISRAASAGHYNFAKHFWEKHNPEMTSKMGRMGNPQGGRKKKTDAQVAGGEVQAEMEAKQAEQAAMNQPANTSDDVNAEVAANTPADVNTATDGVVVTSRRSRTKGAGSK